MHPLDITSFLDERISELTNDHLPEEPNYPSGQTQYASFMMPRDHTMSLNGKSSDKWPANSPLNGGWDDPKAPPDNGTKDGCVAALTQTLTSRSETNHRDPY